MILMVVKHGSRVRAPPKIGKHMIFWRKIVIFHTKYPKYFRASLRNWKKYDFLASNRDFSHEIPQTIFAPTSARRHFFKCAPPLTWNPGSAPEIIWYFNRIDAVDRPTVVYACTLCDPSNQKKIKSIEQVQKRAARFVHNNYRHRTPGCVIKMVNSLKWENLEDRRKSARLCTLFKF
jgi:hypothetical protein